MTIRNTIEMEDLVCVINQILDSQPELGTLSPKSRLHEDLGLDSLGLVRLQVAIEDEFTIHFDPMAEDLAEAFETVGSLLQLVQHLHRKAH